MEVQAQKLLLKSFQEVLALDEVWDYTVKKRIHVQDNSFCWKKNISLVFLLLHIIPGDMTEYKERQSGVWGT